MNNYCTNCGKKLESNVIKCDECNTYVVDLKTINKKKIFHIISVIIIVLVLGIIATIICYSLYYKNLNKSIYKKYLKDEFSEAQYAGYDSCRACEGSCDGGCGTSPKIVGCFKYYYKSKPNIEKPDIVVFSNKGDISIDFYSSIINKYGFNEEQHDDDDDAMYQTEKRESLYIDAEYINDDNIVRIYKMVNEIIDAYKKDNNNFLDVKIYGDNHHINISNSTTNNKVIFEWKFNHNIQILDPNLDDVKKLYNQFDDTYSSSNEEVSYND